MASSSWAADVSRSLALAAPLLALKMILTALGTARARLITNKPISPEDGARYGLKAFFRFFLGAGRRAAKSKQDEPPTAAPATAAATAGPAEDPVERWRRVHANDMENIPIFFCAALAYLGLVVSGAATPPSWSVAPLCINVFLYSRLAHSFIYLFVQRQPWRAVAWAVGVTSTVTLCAEAIIARCGTA
jgi:uncharacterized MAPEG superfamily protein